MNAPAQKPGPTLEDATDEELREEMEERGLWEGEPDIGDFSDRDIRAEYESRFGLVETHEEALNRMTDELYRNRIQVPEIVKDFIYTATGRTLP